MRIAALAIAALVAGGFIGGWLGGREFAHEELPLDVRPAGTIVEGGQAEPAGPRLTILNGEKFDFGEMDREAKMKHTFEIQNDGDQPLSITENGTSCKCTTAGLSQDLLAPGEKAEITLEWDAKNAVEPFEQYADYKTNDLRRQRFRLSVTGRIVEAIRAEPGEAIFNRVSALEAVQAKLKLLGGREKELKIISHKFKNTRTATFFGLHSRPLTEEELQMHGNAQCGLELTVEMQPGMPLGQISQALNITTNLNPNATLEIPVFGTVISDISLAGQQASPDQMLVALGSIAASKGTKSTVYLVIKGPYRDQTELRIAEVAPASELKVELGTPIRDNPKIISHPIVLEVPPGVTPISRLTAASGVVVRIATTHPQIKEVSFRVRYAVVD
jgi:hypothetical protein